MALYTTEAILLEVRNWGEADKMLQLFSRARGRIRAAAFGCRRPKSPLSGALQLFNRLEITLTEGERVDTVRQASVRQRFPSLTNDLTAMAYASFVAELLLELTPEGDPDEKLYDWLPNVLSACGPRNPRLVALIAGYQLLAFAGVGFKLEECCRCGRPVEAEGAFSVSEGGALCASCAGETTGSRPYPASLREFLLLLSSLDWQAPAAFTAKKDDLIAAETFLLGGLYHLLGKNLKSLGFIRQLAG